MMNNTVMMSTLVAALALAGSAAGAAPECKQQQVEQSAVEMCLVRGTDFIHDVYMLKVDQALVFALADDFADNIVLEHTILEGPALEFPLSRQGSKVVRITGGCKPVVKQQGKSNVEVARTCSFSWGKYQVVKDVRFEFE
jgi:hypothetical protein